MGRTGEAGAEPQLGGPMPLTGVLDREAGRLLLPLPPGPNAAGGPIMGEGARALRAEACVAIM